MLILKSLAFITFYLLTALGTKEMLNKWFDNKYNNAMIGALWPVAIPITLAMFVFNGLYIAIGWCLNWLIKWFEI